MSDNLQLSAEPKDRAGKGAARAVRRAGRVPAVIYGDKKPPLMVTLDPQDLRRQINTGAFFSTLVDLKIGGQTNRVLARDLQLHPVTDQPLHVDFLRVSAQTQINVNVPVSFLNEEECLGLKRGGLLNVVRYEVEVYCRADDIPAGFEIEGTLRPDDAGDTGPYNWIGELDRPQIAEARDDRYVAAIDLRDQQPVTLAYIVRAVTPGSFAMPGAVVEDMYRPDVFGRSAADRVVIAPRS